MSQKPKFDFFERIDRGIKRGVAQALANHRKAGEKVVVWQKGKIVEILPPARGAKKSRSA
jgi:hypothetical protein